MICIKKYFSAVFAIFAVLGIQLGFGVNSANAVPCEESLRAFWDEATFFPADYDNPADNIRKGDKVKEIYLTYDTRAYHAKTYEIALEKFPMLALGIEEKYGKSCKGPLSGSISDNSSAMKRCLVNYLWDNNCDVSAFKISGSAHKGNQKSSSSSNQSSSSGSSSQSNKKANQQSANNQSSSSVDERVKKINDAVDQGNHAHDNKDYAKSIAAIKYILANSSNITLKGEATNRLAEYYKYGHGVPKDEVKAQALFEQASIAGNSDANAHICQNYDEGTGGVSKNHQTAIKYCTEAANKGHLISMSKLGYLYHAGIGTINPQLGNEWICKAAKQGDDVAIGNAEKLKLNCN